MYRLRQVHKLYTETTFAGKSAAAAYAYNKPR